MPILEGILTSMCFVALAEVGDKTMFATMAVAMRYNFTTAILTSTLAFTISSIAVALGAHYIAQLIPLNVLNTASALLFIAVGALILRDALQTPGEKREPHGGDAKLPALLASMILAELGDKTQISVFTLTLSLGVAAAVAGGVLGYLAVNTASSAISHYMRKALSLRKAMLASSAIFIAVGLAKLAAALL